MDKYECKYGNGNGGLKAYSDLLDQPGEYRDDDGIRHEVFCQRCADEEEPHTNCLREHPVCGDCSKGTLCWAEAGYVPWHRICDHCGSHWDLHLLPDGKAYYERAKFYGG
jgi:hypothetical protein